MALFSIPAVPLGDYVVTVSQVGFTSIRQTLALASDNSLTFGGFHNDPREIYGEVRYRFHY